MMLGSAVDSTPENSLEDLYDMALGVAPDIAKGAATRFKMPISFKQVNTGWYYLKVNCINIVKSSPWAVPRIRILHLDV